MKRILCMTLSLVLGILVCTCENSASETLKDAPLNEALQSAPSKEYAYVGTGMGDIYIFTIEPGGNMLTVDIVGGLHSVYDIAIHSQYKVLYALDLNEDKIHQFAIGEDGKLQALSNPTEETKAMPTCIRIHPSGDYVYVANAYANSIQQFSVEEGTGTLTLVSTFKIGAACFDRNSLAFDADGNYLYAYDYYQKRLYQFAVDTNGSLSPLSTEYLAGQNTSPIQWGKYVFSGSDNKTNQYIIQTNGILTVNQPDGISVPASYFAFSNVMHPSEKYLYSILMHMTEDSLCYQYGLSENGTLSFIKNTDLPKGIIGLTFDSSGNYAYGFDNNLSSIYQYRVTEDGGFESLSIPEVQISQYPRKIVMFKP